MKRVLTFGVFDVLHVGHMLLFEQAKQLGNQLAVAVQNETVVKEYKPDACLVYTTDERQFMVNAIRYVDQVLVYRNVDVDIRNIVFDVLVKGPEQIHSGFRRAVDWCRNNGKMVITNPRS